jgi:SNF2 family DNA or RNA helicase
LSNPGAFLTFAPRVGKTSTAAVSAASALAGGAINTVVVLYPNSVKHEWERQFPLFTQGLPLYALTGTESLQPVLPTREEKETDKRFAKRMAAFEHERATLQWLYETRFLVLGLHYELLRAESKAGDGSFSSIPVVKSLQTLLAARGPYAAIADEAHVVRNRKAPRAQLLIELGSKAAFRWVLSGTPLRNYPRDMWVLWDFIQKGSMGSYSKYTSRYADGHMGDHGWLDKGKSNVEELHARLALVQFRKTRQDVASWLPRSERSVILCEMTKEQMRVYKAQEAAAAPQILKTLKDEASALVPDALRELAKLTSASKLDKLVERVRYHADRKVKVLVFANYHETLKAAFLRLKAETEAKGEALEAGLFIAGGWMEPEKRKEHIEAWKKAKSPAMLLVNAISSGVGIDLADAEVALGLELSWVPSDFLQMESRIQDVHLGKATTSRLYEYLLVRGTVDEDMASKLIAKISAADAIVGTDEHAAQVHSTLTASGVVDRSVLELASEDPEVVAGAIDSLRARLFGADSEGVTDDGDNDTQMEDDNGDSDDDEKEEDEN